MKITTEYAKSSAKHDRPLAVFRDSDCLNVFDSFGVVFWNRRQYNAAVISKQCSS